MSKTTWLILGATSIIAKEFAHLVAQSGQNLILVGRNSKQLALMAADIRLRYAVNCEELWTDFAADLSPVTHLFEQKKTELALFFAYSQILPNSALSHDNINDLLRINVISTTEIIHAYLLKPQKDHRILYLSSVAACRGRAKNSLYGASKAAIEIYLEGLAQAYGKNLQVSIARLGFIDTVQTFGQPGIFYASPPKACAKACWHAINKGKFRFYHPFFWRFIMGIISRLPHFIYNRIGGL